MRTDDFDYPLPDELIAQAPAEPRDTCRLLVLRREDGSVEHRRFSDVIDYLEPGDVLVANQTRVMPARLIGRKPTGGVAETLLLRRREDVDPMGHVWECLVNPGKRLSSPAPWLNIAPVAPMLRRIHRWCSAPRSRILWTIAEAAVWFASSHAARTPLASRAPWTRRFTLPAMCPCHPISPNTRAIPRSTRPSTP